MQEPLFYYPPPAPILPHLTQLDPHSTVKETLRVLGVCCLQCGIAPLYCQVPGRQSRQPHDRVLMGVLGIIMGVQSAHQAFLQGVLIKKYVLVLHAKLKVGKKDVAQQTR